MATLHNRPSHVLALPVPIFALRIVQLVTAIAILGLAAYGITFVAFDGIALSLFTAIATMIIAVYYFVASTGLPAAYNYWAIIGLDIFAIIFWLISFAVTAAQVSAYSWYYSTGYSCTYYYGYCVKKRELAPRATTNIYTYRNAMAAAAGLGGLEFILFIITLVFTAIYVVRHRKAGGHCTAARAAQTGPAPGAAPVAGGPPPVIYSGEPKPVGTEYQAQQPVYQPQPQQPQQQYTPPPQQQYVPSPQQHYTPPPQQQYTTPPPQEQQPPYQAVPSPNSHQLPG